MILDMSGSDAPWLAIAFNAVLIPDQIDIYFNDSSNLLTSRITGQTGLTTNYLVNPIRYQISSGGYRFVINIPNAVNGKRDVIIKVTPSILHPTVKETDWSLALACLTPDKYNPSCNYLDASFKELVLTDWYAKDNTASCRREYGIKLNKPPIINYNKTGLNPTALSTYSNATDSKTSFSLYSSAHPYASAYLTYSKVAVTDPFYNPGWSTPANMNGSMIYKKLNNIVTFTFTDLSDYLLVKNNYDASKNSPQNERISLDPKKLSHYRAWNFSYRSFSGGCLTDPLGDNMVIRIYYHWPVDFNAGTKQITITCSSVINQVDQVPCEPAWGLANGTASALTTYANSANVEHQTDCFTAGIFGVLSGYLDEPNTVVATERTASFNILSHALSVPCDFPFHCKSMNSNVFALSNIKVIIDIELDYSTGDFPKDVNGTYIKDPLKWFSIWNRLNKNNNCATNDTHRILKVENGIAVETKQWNDY
jgi:hypothetical protein